MRAILTLSLAVAGLLVPAVLGQLFNLRFGFLLQQ